MLIKRGNLDTDQIYPEGRRHAGTKKRWTCDRSDVSTTSQGRARVADTHQKPAETRTIFPWSLHREHGPKDALISNLQLSDLGE